MLKIPFFRKGHWSHPKYGVISADQNKFDQFRKNFKANVLGRQPFIRIGHSKDSAASFGDAEAKAWVQDIVQDGDVLYALAEATDPKVEQDIRSKKYRFASAEYNENYMDKESGKNLGTVLSAIALTNEPFLTKLPENVVLADDSETFYLDYKNMEGGNVMDEFIKKMTELFNALLEKLKGQPAKEADPKNPAAQDDKQNAAVQNLLAEVEAMKTKLAAFESSSKTMADDNTALKKDVAAREMDLKLAELKQKGIPPVLCDKAKEILLAAPAAGETIKLADGTEKKLTDMVYGLLETLPESSRVPFEQQGSGHAAKPGELTTEQIKKLADEDVAAMGGKVTAEGKYVL